MDVQDGLKLYRAADGDWEYHNASAKFRNWVTWCEDNFEELCEQAYPANSMIQIAPWPEDLQRLVEGLKHRRNWYASLENIDRGQGCQGTTLIVHITEPDAYHEGRDRSVVHYFPVPGAAYDYRSWRRWLFNQLNSISLHEEMENFTIDGVKPYAPSHGPGNDPYMVREVGTELDQATSFRGEVKLPKTDDETDRLRKLFDEGKLTCEEAGDRCKNECTIDMSTGKIADPDCFR